MKIITNNNNDKKDTHKNEKFNEMKQNKNVKSFRILNKNKDKFYLVIKLSFIWKLGTINLLRSIECCIMAGFSILKQ